MRSERVVEFLAPKMVAGLLSGTNAANIEESEENKRTATSVHPDDTGSVGETWDGRER